MRHYHNGTALIACRGIGIITQIIIRRIYKLCLGRRYFIHLGTDVITGEFRSKRAVDNALVYCVSNTVDRYSAYIGRCKLCLIQSKYAGKYSKIRVLGYEPVLPLAA